MTQQITVTAGDMKEQGESAIKGAAWIGGAAYMCWMFDHKLIGFALGVFAVLGIVAAISLIWRATGKVQDAAE